VVVKILGVKPIYGGSYPIMEYAIRALYQLGYDVTAVDFSFLFPLLQHIKTTGDAQAVQSLKETASRTLFEVVDATQPDIIFGIAQAPIFLMFLDFVRNGGF
jgi:hypothetical protein